MTKAKAKEWLSFENEIRPIGTLLERIKFGVRAWVDVKQTNGKATYTARVAIAHANYAGTTTTVLKTAQDDVIDLLKTHGLLLPAIAEKPAKRSGKAGDE